MFTLKCAKPNGQMHVYEVTGYTIHPPERNAAGETVTVVEGWTPGHSGHIPHHVCRDSDFHYREIYIENAHGKTIEVIRGSTPIPEKVPEEDDGTDPRSVLQRRAEEEGSANLSGEG